MYIFSLVSYLAIISEDNFDASDGFLIGIDSSSCMVRAPPKFPKRILLNIPR
jgi:hypothetical protein